MNGDRSQASSSDPTQSEAIGVTSIPAPPLAERSLAPDVRTIEPSAQTELVSIGTALPPFRSPQPVIAQFLARTAEAQASCPRSFPRRVLAMAESSGIDARYCVIPDYIAESPDAFTFYPKTNALDPFPTTRERMALYERSAVPLAARAASEALARGAIAPGDVSHLVISTCTGFFAPGPDFLLADALGLPPAAERLQIGFMGCHAGLNAMRAADQIVRAHPSATVLQVSVELCSLHFQREPTMQNLVANTIFADGASAAVYRAAGRGPGLGVIRGSSSLRTEGTRESMRWEIGDHGFVMSLAVDIPDRLEEIAAPFARRLCAEARIDPESIVGYAIHPGGKKIITAAARGLGIDESEAASSLGVLRDMGNMSSAAILFVLERELARVRRPGHVLMLGFGPGLTVEGVALEVS